METENTKCKYIVYQTTNTVNNYIYIGVHKTKDPDVFDGYLGCGVYNSWPYTYMFAKTKFQEAVKKYGPKNFNRTTIAVFNTAEEAFNLEEEIVNEAFLERHDVYNMVLGGIYGMYEGKKIPVYRYTLNGDYMEEFPSFAEAAAQLNCDYTLISYAVRKKSIAKKSFWNTDKQQHIDLTNYTFGSSETKQIYVYDLEGSFVREYESIAEAAHEFNTYTRCISRSAELGILFNKEWQFCFIKADNYSIAKFKYFLQREVFKYNPDGSFNKAYTTQLDAEKENPGVNISKAIRLKAPDKNNFFWSTQFLKNYNRPKLSNKKRKVGKYTLDNKLVKIYDSATAAERDNGTSVWKVLNGTNQSHKQHIYKYLS